MKSKITLTNVKSYIEGTLRYKLYYSDWFAWLIRVHIYEQIQLRIMVMDKVCYDTGSCKLCGCSTTALQMAKKACDKPCYPKLMSRKLWKQFKNGMPYHDRENNLIWLYENENKIISYKLEGLCGKSKPLN